MRTRHCDEDDVDAVHDYDCYRCPVCNATIGPALR